MPSKFDYQGAKQAGYSDDEIMSFLGEQDPSFDIKGAINAGYSPQEINEHLLSYEKPKENKPKRSFGEKAARVGAQFGLGVLEGSPSGIAYDLAVAPLASKNAQTQAYKSGVGEDIERLLEQKQMGQWDEKDQELYDHLTNQIKDPKEAEKYVQTTDLSIRGLAEKATGVDLHPEGILEKGAAWIGMIRDPKRLVGVGRTPKEFIKAISPTKTDVLRGAAAGTALEAAEKNEFGPIGTMAAAVAADLLAHGTGKATGKAVELITKPKETLAKEAAKLAPKEQLELHKEMIEDFRKSGIQADLGTLTESNVIKWAQSRIAQSGLAGKALDEFKETLTNQIKQEYASLASELGEARFATAHEAGTVVKEGVKAIRDADLGVARTFFQDAEKSLKANAFVKTDKLGSFIDKLEAQLKPGSIKSTEQNAVLNVLDKLKQDVMDANGNLMQASVKDLMNNKIALNDIINYEVQGGTKQLLKGLVSEIDRAIISHGKDNPTFAKNYIKANKKFSEHAKTFRNKTVNNILNAEDPATLMNKMNTVHGIKTLGNILNRTPQGREIFKKLKSTKLEDVVGKNLVDSSTQQVKLGTFSKLLEKGKNAEIIKEILGPVAFKRLERLQKNAGKLSDAVNKFYNASKSGVVAADAAIVVQGMSGVANLLVGNPWPLLKVTGGIIGAKKLGKLLSDPEFLKLTEEAILASEKGTEKELVNSFERLRPYVVQALNENQS